MSSKLTKEFKEKIAEEFIQCLEGEEYDWKKQWGALSAPCNAVSKNRYKGVNRFYLSLLMLKHDWKDNRFATFNQIKDKGWKLKAGSKGCKVEFWFPFDNKEKKAISWDEYKKLIKGMSESEIDDRFGLLAKYFTVFNGSMIEKIPELVVDKEKNIRGSEAVEKISEGMDVEILHDGRDRAFYRPSEDKIHLPEKNDFDDEAAYNSTALHELGHATGAAHRLNRALCGMFGSEEYAKEELVAEITSAFMSVYVDETNVDLDNHKAYIQSWIAAIKEKPETLTWAIKLAEQASTYMEEKGRLLENEKVDKHEHER